MACEVTFGGAEAARVALVLAWVVEVVVSTAIGLGFEREQPHPNAVINGNEHTIDASFDGLMHTPPAWRNRTAPAVPRCKTKNDGDCESGGCAHTHRACAHASVGSPSLADLALPLSAHCATLLTFDDRVGGHRCTSC